MARIGTILSVFYEDFMFLRNTGEQRNVRGLGQFTTIQGFNSTGKTTLAKATEFGFGGLTNKTGRVCLCLQGTSGPIVFERKRLYSDEFLINSRPVTKSVYMRKLKALHLSSIHSSYLVPSQNWADLVTNNRIVDFLENALDGGVRKRKELALLRPYVRELHRANQDETRLKNMRAKVMSVMRQRRKAFESFLGKVEEKSTRIFKLIRGNQNSSIIFKFYGNQHYECDVLLIDDSKEMCASSFSGGQKKMASLAIYLAVAELKKFPFVFFDDGDKHIHENAAKKISEGLKEVSNKVQIVLTCNDGFIGEHATTITI